MASLPPRKTGLAHLLTEKRWNPVRHRRGHRHHRHDRLAAVGGDRPQFNGLGITTPFGKPRRLPHHR
jgi:hypothetical protein